MKNCEDNGDILVFKMILFSVHCTKSFEEVFLEVTDIICMHCII